MTSTTTAPAANHTFFMLVKTTPTWLALTPTERFGFLGEVIAPILERNPNVHMRFFDSEAFASRYSDVVMWETADVLAYQAVVEELRETKFWDHYFSVVEIVAAIENGYARHYDVEPMGG
jgi:chlorite dismutase